ncbi:MAG: 3-oxoadipate enol-lactonase, partial [Lysobacterales bacterium]
ERLGKLVVCATDARIGSAESWQARSAQVRAEGLAPLAQVTAQRWFTPAFIGARPEIVEDILARFVATSVEGYCGCCEVLAGADLRADLARIANPLLAISGDDDPVCTPADLEAIAQGVADGRHLSLPGRHIVNIESADAFSAALVAFLR